MSGRQRERQSGAQTQVQKLDGAKRDMMDLRLRLSAALDRVIAQNKRDKRATARQKSQNIQKLRTVLCCHWNPVISQLFP